MEQRQLSFGEAVNRALTTNYCNFQGRASRSEYWWYALFILILNFAIGFICGITGFNVEIITAIVSLALLLPGLGLCVRRLHDVGKSGWYLLFGLIPLIGAIILIVFYCKESQPYANKYGDVPNLI